MNRLTRHVPGIASLALVLVVALVALAAPLAAQEGTTVPAEYPVNTITVSGVGSAAGRPDIANLEMGVDMSGGDIAAVFSEVNTTIEQVIAAVVAAGVASEDIRTTGLDIFTEGPYGALDPQAAQERVYRVSNRVRVTVRDTAAVSAVINAAVEAGANNLFGLTFGIDNRAALETQARAAAMEDARARAAELAALSGATLGEVIVVQENSGFFGPFDALRNLGNQGLGGGDGATIEPGGLSVTVQLQVSFRMVR